MIETGKRFGKTIWAIFELIRVCREKKDGVFWYIAPTYRQAKDIAWKGVKEADSEGLDKENP